MVQKIFAGKKQMGTFFCPECGKEKQMDLSKFMHMTKEVKLKYTCTCTSISCGS